MKLILSITFSLLLVIQSTCQVKTNPFKNAGAFDRAAASKNTAGFLTGHFDTDAILDTVFAIETPYSKRGVYFVLSEQQNNYIVGAGTGNSIVGIYDKGNTDATELYNIDIYDWMVYSKADIQNSKPVKEKIATRKNEVVRLIKKNKIQLESDILVVDYLGDCMALFRLNGVFHFFGFYAEPV